MASVFTVTTGKTLNTHESFKSQLPWGSCKNVPNSKDCDVILAFCPVTSRVGTDIEAALRTIPEGKPLALVVLHHTLDSNYTLPDTKRFMKRPDSITVDCLFTDDGLMRCPCNDDAVRAVAKFLQQHGKRSLRGKLALGLLILISLYVAISTFTDFTLSVNTSHDKNRCSMSDKTKRTNISQRFKPFMLFYVKYKAKDKCFLGVWGMRQCRPRYTTQQLIAVEIIHATKKLELRMQQGYQELERKVNERMNSFDKEIKTYQELNRKANKKIESLEKEVNNCKESEGKVNEKINDLEKEVERLRTSLEQCPQNSQKSFSGVFQWLTGDTEEKALHDKAESKNDEMDGNDKQTNEKEVSAPSPPEPSQNSEEKALHDKAEVKNDEMDGNDKQTNEKEVSVPDKVSVLDESSVDSSTYSDNKTVSSAQEFNRKANKKIESLEKEVNNCKESEGKVNEKINDLEKEVERLRTSLEQCPQNSQKSLSEVFQWLTRDTEEKALHDKAESKNDEMDGNDKQTNEKEVSVPDKVSVLDESSVDSSTYSDNKTVSSAKEDSVPSS
ncbi:girdin homolog [Sardina pilchardus]|uniref:girdin homolog n=1 Tax=Sardina pilchardus TaxID=27697 RepID=UPI002E0F3115